MGACGAVVLAAGEARRFGAPKLVMPFGDSTVLGSVVGALASAGISPIVVVAGPDAEAIRESLGDRQVDIVRNPDPSRGMVSSVRIGVERLPDSLDRFLIALGDQPRIRAEGISRLVREHTMSGKGIGIPTYGERRGHPVVFSGSCRREIIALTDKQTLGDLIQAHSDDLLEVDLDSDAYVCDIDTREDYENELRRWHASVLRRRASARRHAEQ
jgi:molybdenum cofactor cytidylyltransferase